MVSSLLPWLVTLCVARIAKSTAIEQLYVDKECSTYTIHNVNEHDIYEIVWNNGTIPFYCRFGFIGQGYDILDRYKMCVEVIEYEVKDCNVQLMYFIGFDIQPDKTYSCHQTPSIACAEGDKYFDVQLSRENIFVPSQNYSRFRLKVTATKTYDYSDHADNIGKIVGGVLGGIALLAICVSGAIAFICNVRKRKTQGHTCSASTSNTTMSPYNQPAPTTMPVTIVAQHVTNQHYGQPQPVVSLYPNQQNGQTYVF